DRRLEHNAHHAAPGTGLLDSSGCPEPVQNPPVQPELRHSAATTQTAPPASPRLRDTQAAHLSSSSTGITHRCGEYPAVVTTRWNMASTSPRGAMLETCG